MSANKRLKVIGPNDVPPPQMTVLEAANAGDRMASLLAIQRRLAATLANPKTYPRDMASISLRLLEIGKEIEAIKSEREESELAGAHVEDEAWTAI